MPVSYQVHRFKKADDSEKPRRFVRMAGLCRYLQKSQMTLWRLTHDESLNFPKHIEVRGTKFYDLDLVDKWLEERVVG